MKDIFSDDVLDSIDGSIAESLSAKTFGVGDMIDNRFKVERVVGRGNFGYVYRVKDTQSGKTRALKVFYERLTKREGVGDNLKQLGTRLAESTHANTVRLFEVGQAGDQVYWVEEFIGALTLDKLVGAVRKHAADQGFPADQMAELFRQTCRALEDLSEFNHYGLHPQNIFMSKQGVKIADLGVAGAVRPALTEKDFAVMSAQAFWAPEFRRDGLLSPTADVYALGRLLEYLLTLGNLPPDGKPPVVRGPHGKALVAAARSAADPDADMRPNSASAFLGSFESALAAPGDVPAAVEPVAEADEEPDSLERAAETASEALGERALTEEPEAQETPAVDVGQALEEVEEEFFGKQEPLLSDQDQGELPLVEPEVAPLPEAEAEAVAEPEAPAEPEAEPVPKIAAKKKPAETKPSPWRWLVAAVIVAGLIGVVYFALPRGPVTPPAPATPTPIPEPERFDLEGISIRPEPGGPTFEEMVDAMLVQADMYFKTNRITDPPEESAYGIYQFILEMDPDNKTAGKGIDKVKNHYLTLGRGLLKKKNYDKAAWSFRKVLLVDEENGEAKRSLTKIAKLEAQTPKTPEPVNVASNPPPEPGGDPIAPPPEPTPTPTKPEVKSRITATDIKSTIAKYMGRVKFCFAKSPDASGVVKVRFTINPSGKVTGAAVASSTIGDNYIEQCLVRRVSLMQFPAYQGSPKPVTFPFRFNQ